MRTPGSFAAARNTMSGAFSGWIRPTNATIVFVERQAQRGPGGPAVAGAEHVEVHSGMDDVDPRGVGVVNRDQLPGLIVGVDDQPVRLVDDLLLPDRAQRRLGRVASARAAFLTAARVCAVCTSGTAQRSRASQPTCPDSQ